jgi:hypothetical protein
MLPLILLSLAFLPQEQQPADARRQSDDERRGDPRRQVTCESPGGYVRCPAPNGWRGARMVRQLSNASCSRNVSWGYDKEYIWVTRGCRGVFDAGDEYANEGERVTCSSPGRRVTCPADTRKGVELVRQLSESRCERGETWGTRDNAIWVDRGCRAEFRVGRGGGRPGGEGRTVECESPGTRVKCRVDGTERGVRLVRQLSNAACTRNVSWGWDRDGIWVDRGCRGIFESGDPEASAGEQVVCSSGGKFVRCRADTRQGVELSRQLSDAACVAGETWGYERDYVWVDRGCRAEFRMAGGYRALPPPNKP